MGNLVSILRVLNLYQGTVGMGTDLVGRLAGFVDLNGAGGRGKAKGQGRNVNVLFGNVAGRFEGLRTVGIHTNVSLGWEIQERMHHGINNSRSACRMPPNKNGG